LGDLSASEDSEDEDLDSVMAEKYMLRVTAGASYDMSQQKPVFVNTDIPTVFENEFMKSSVKVRIKGYEGLPRGSRPYSPYFEDPMHTKDQYSIEFSFVPKKDLESLDVVWGNDFDHPIRDRLPPAVLFNAAMKIVTHVIDPGIEYDAYADEPWLYAPAVSTLMIMNIGNKSEEYQYGELPHPPEGQALREGADGDGHDVRRLHGLSENNNKRRKHLLNNKNRERFILEKDRLYQWDFFNPYIDFQKFKLRLPGFSLSCLGYINDKTHHLRYVFKNRKTGDLYFVVIFTLLFADDVDRALEEENARIASENSSMVDLEKRVDTPTIQELKDAPEPIVVGADAG
jgi:hypothetical protein